MHRRIVQCLGTVPDAKEAGTLLISLGPQLGHRQQLLAAAEAALLLPLRHNVFGDGLGNAGNVLEKRCRGGIHIHTHMVYAVLHHSAQLLTQLGLVHIMLILSHADGLGVDLHQLRQWILKASRHGGSASLSHIKIGEFLGGQLAGGIHRGTGFIDDDILHRQLRFPEEIRNDLLRLPGGGTIAQADDLHMPAADQLLDGFHGLSDFILGCRGVNDRGIQYLAGGVHHRDLAAGAEGRIPAQHHLARNGRLHEKLLQIAAEDLDGAILGLLRQLVPDVCFDRRSQQTLVGIPYRVRQIFRGLRIAAHPQVILQIPENFLLRCLQLHTQHLLLFTPVDGQDPMPGDFPDRLGIVIKILVYSGLRRLLLVFGLRNQQALIPGFPADPAAIVGVIGDLLCQNVLRSGNGGVGVHDILFRIHILRGFLRHRAGGIPLQKILCQRRQSLFPGNHGSGAALRLIGPIQILQLYHGFCGLNLCPELRRHFPLLLDGADDGFLPLLQVP